MTTRRLVPLALSPLALSMMLWGAPTVGLAAPAPDDPYLAGYAGAVLEREFKLPGRAVTVDNGVLTLDGAQLAGADRAALVKTLSYLPGVVRVEVREPAAKRCASSSAATRPVRWAWAPRRHATSVSRNWPTRPWPTATRTWPRTKPP